MSRDTLSLPAARRTALRAQGFGRSRPEWTPGIRDVQAVTNRLGQFQIDSINIVTRAHFMPLFSRLGGYDPALLERAAHRAPRRLFEYWGHAASLIDLNLQPHLRFRMSEAHREVWGGVERLARANPQLVDYAREQVHRRGPVSARALEVDQVRDRSNWGWNWSGVKTVLEWLFACGEVTSAYRNAQFERVYDIPERVFPPAILARETPTPEDSVVELVRRAAQALGVASDYSLRDYFRTGPATTREAIASLVRSEELIPVTIRGLDGQEMFRWHEATAPRHIDARALLSPFDSMVFERRRLEMLFDFRYRIEIYVPQARRVHGYYVYPFLLGDTFAARVDLKADRARGVLRVNSAWLEAGAEATRVARELAIELAELAAWQGLNRVEVMPRGDLAEPLARSVS